MDHGLLSLRRAAITKLPKEEYTALEQANLRRLLGCCAIVTKCRPFGRVKGLLNQLGVQVTLQCGLNCTGTRQPLVHCTLQCSSANEGAGGRATPRDTVDNTQGMHRMEGTLPQREWRRLLIRTKRCQPHYGGAAAQLRGAGCSHASGWDSEASGIAVSGRAQGCTGA